MSREIRDIGVNAGPHILKTPEEQDEVFFKMFKSQAALRLFQLARQFRWRMTELTQTPSGGAVTLEFERGPEVCYSDHNEDVRTKGSCDYCKGTSYEEE